MTLPMFAGVIDLLEKQELGLSSSRRRHLQSWMLCLTRRPWIPAFAGMTGFAGMTAFAGLTGFGGDDDFRRTTKIPALDDS